MTPAAPVNPTGDSSPQVTSTPHPAVTHPATPASTPAVVVSHPHRVSAPAKQRTGRPRPAPAHHSAARTKQARLAFPLTLIRKTEQLPSAVGRVLTPLSHDDGVLLLLGALALAVLVIASSTMLRLLTRIRDEGWEVRRS